MKFLLPFFIGVLLMSCSKRKELEKSIVTPVEIEPSVIAMEKYDSSNSVDYDAYYSSLDILDIDSVWLNDKVAISTNQNNVLNLLGEPDSIIGLQNECGAFVAGEEPWGDTVNIWYYHGSEIVTYKDKAEIVLVKLHNWNWTLHHPRFIFTEYTTLDDLSKVFSNTMNAAYEVKSDKEKPYKIVPMLPKANSDDQWFLFFYEEKLEKIEYWVSC